MSEADQRPEAIPVATPAGTAAPLPMASLAYGTPWQRKRPGIITAIGVVSVLVAALSLIGGLITGVQMLGIGFALSVSRSTAAASTAATPVPTTGPATAPAPLGPADVQAVLSEIETTAKTKLTAAQTKAITAQLDQPGQQLVDAAPTTQAVADQVSYAAKNPGGEVTFLTANGHMTVAADGTVRSVSQHKLGAIGMPKFQVPPFAMIVAILAWVISLGLAVYLLVCGIMTLRQSLRAGRLHAIYAWGKIPVNLVWGVAMAWVWSALFKSADFGSGAPGSGELWGPMAFMVGAPALVGCVYPVALLIVLRTRTVREYYATVA